MLGALDGSSQEAHRWISDTLTQVTILHSVPLLYAVRALRWITSGVLLQDKRWTATQIK